MSWLKKGPVLGLLGGGLLLWLLVFFFFDPFLKLALVNGAQAAVGARVDVASLRTRWLAGTMEIRGVEAADREDTMRNLVSFDRAAFRLDMSAALRGKAVVREAAIDGLRSGTARARDGKLPSPPPPSKLELLVREKIAPAKSASLAQAATVKSNAVGTVDAAKLGGLKKVEEAKAKATAMETRWKAKAGEAKALEDEARAVGEQVKALGQGGTSPQDLLRKAGEAKKAQAQIKDLINRSNALRDDAKKDLAEVQAAIKEADELRKKDLNGLLAEAGLPTLDADDLSRRLLGAQTASRLSTALKWLRWAREKAAAKKASNPPPPPRRRGVDVEFPRAHAYPQLLIEGARLSGALDESQAGRPLALNGLLTGVTSNPKLYGKPALLELNGRSEGMSLSLKARLDQQNDPTGVVLDIEGSGFPLAGTSLGDGEVGGALKAGLGSLKGTLRSAGDEWKGEFLAAASGVKLEPKVSVPGKAGELVTSALRGVDRVTIKVGVSGKEDDLKLAFSSDLGAVVAAAMRKAVAGELDAQRKALEAKVNALYDAQLKGVRTQADGLAGGVLGLDKQKDGLDKLLKDAVSKSLGGGPLRLDKLFK